jgi:hypothetical protein
MGLPFLGVLQTKDLESLMDTYWLSFDGRLYKVTGEELFTPSALAGTTLDDRLEPYPKSGPVRFVTRHKEQTIEVSTFFSNGVLSSVDSHSSSTRLPAECFYCYDLWVHREDPHENDPQPVLDRAR